MRSGYTMGYTVAAKTLAKRYIVESGGKSYRAVIQLTHTHHK